MQVDFDLACIVFNVLPKTIKAPQLDPEYVVFDTLRDKTLEPIFFVFQDNDNIFYCAVHKSMVEGTNYYDLQSPYGYGGPIATTQDKLFLDKAWDAYSEWCMDNQILVEFIRFHPILQNWNYYGGDILYNRETVWINLEQDDLMSEYRPRARTSIRKAIKSGLKITWYDGEPFIDIFVPLYYQEMIELQAEEFYMFKKDYFEAIAKWDKAKFAVCSLDQQILAAAIFIFDGDVMEYHLSASNPEGKRLCATNLILHEAAFLGKNLGFKSLHLGGGTDSKPDNSLLFFKAGFSRNRSHFKIGRKVYRKEEYEQLKRDWQENRQINCDKVLFYR
jgi:hypothetical protein